MWDWGERESKDCDTDWEFHHFVKTRQTFSVDRGASGKSSQEATEMTNGASLISMQPYQGSLSSLQVSPVTPSTGTGSPCRASYRKHEFGIFFFTRVRLLIFRSWFRFLSLSLPPSLSSPFHFFIHTCARSTKHLHLRGTAHSPWHLLIITARSRAGCLTFFPFRKIGGISGFFSPLLILPFLPLCESPGEVLSPSSVWRHYSALSRKTLTRLSHWSHPQPPVHVRCQDWGGELGRSVVMIFEPRCLVEANFRIVTICLLHQI